MNRSHRDYFILGSGLYGTVEAALAHAKAALGGNGFAAG